MTGTEERAAREAIELIRSGWTYEEAMRQVTSEFNLKDSLSVSEVAKGVEAVLRS